MRLPRPHTARQHTEHDRVLLDRARQLEDAGSAADVDRAKFIRGLVADGPCTLLDELGVRRWLRHVPAGGLAHPDAQWREYHRRTDAWHRAKISARGMRPLADLPRPPVDEAATFGG